MPYANKGADQPAHLRSANNKGADQPAHLCSLISTFVVSCLDSTLKTKSNFTAYIYMKKLFNSHFSSEIMGIIIRFSCHALSEEVQTNLR